MDFAYHYTQVQEDFRQETTAWLDAALPAGGEGLREAGPDGQRARNEFRRTLGERGWLAPLDSTEVGGGGLSPDQNVVLLEELNSRGVLSFLEDAELGLRTALLTWGSAAQRDRLVLPLAAGQMTVWKQWSVGGHRLDPDAVGVTADPDADGYILGGQASFSGNGPSPSWLWTMALVESEGADQLAAASLLVSPTLDGVEIATPRSLANDAVRQVSFNQVWVPRSDLLGDEGGPVMRAAVSLAPGADLPTTLETETDALLEYARTRESHGEQLSAEPVRQQLLVEAYIASRVMRLLRMRAGWLNDIGQGDGHEEAEAALWRERTSQRLSEVVQQVVGVYAQLDESDPRAVAGGRFERLQRRELAARAERGSPEELIAASLGLVDATVPASEVPGKDECQRG